jgi:hypothetical protein
LPKGLNSALGSFPLPGFEFDGMTFRLADANVAHVVGYYCLTSGIVLVPGEN